MSAVRPPSAAPSAPAAPSPCLRAAGGHDAKVTAVCAAAVASRATSPQRAAGRGRPWSWRWRAVPVRVSKGPSPLASGAAGGERDRCGHGKQLLAVAPAEVVLADAGAPAVLSGARARRCRRPRSPCTCSCGGYAHRHLRNPCTSPLAVVLTHLAPPRASVRSPAASASSALPTAGAPAGVEVT